MIINAGVKEIVYLDGYPDILSKDILSESGIEFRAYSIPATKTEDD
jgi:dCMP deaminase